VSPRRPLPCAPRVHNAAVVSESVVGRVGTVVNGIRGGQRPGEVRLMVAGIAHYYLAYAATALPAGTDVLVINNRGARQVDVEPWPPVPTGEGPAAS
jgi:membrane protein implicated in regulation of membrane protease activity